MRKILLVLSIIGVLSSPCFASITPQESMSEKYIKKHGHSAEMSRLIDLQNSQINGVESSYIKTQETWQKVKYPRWCTENRIRWVRKAFQYIDPALDDEKFMQHNIDYTNKYDDL